jgi:maltose-binding protein MalE
MAVVTLPAHRRYAQEAINNMTGNPHNYKILIQSFDNLFPSPHIPNLQEFLTIKQNAIENVWAGLESPEKAMSRLEKKVKRKLKKHQIRVQKEGE